MNIEQVKELLEEIAPEKDAEHRWIDCSESTGYTDDNQYERIVAALKQNIELQIEKDKLLENLQKTQKDLEDTQFDKERQINLNKGIVETYEKALECLKKTIPLANKSLPKDQPLVRIGDYEITYKEDSFELTYKPLPVGKPVTLEIQVVENDTDELCPICNKELGQYPAISRKDNMTKVCSECGTLEALKAWEKSLNAKEENI